MTRIDEQYEFDRFTLVPATCELSHGGAPVHLQPRAFAVLIHLVRNAHRVVSTEELLEHVWAGETVTPSSVTQSIRAVRRALGDDGNDQRFIRTVSRRGYRFVAALGAPSQARWSSMSRGPDSSPVLGRDLERDELLAALRDTLAGSPRAVLIAGEAGIGKTTLVGVLRDDAEALGAAVLLGRCHEDRAAPPYWPWVQVLRALEGAEHSALRDAIASEPPEITARIAALLAPPTAAGPAADRSSMQFYLFAAVVDRLGGLARARPLVIVLEDLHWADVSSLQLLRFLVREARPGRVLVVGTHRSDETRGAPLAELLPSLRSEPIVRTMPLGGLSVEAVSRWVAQVGGDVHLGRALHARTGGNPLFVRELLRSERDDEARLPTAIRELVERRVGRLRDVARLALEVVSVLGEEAHVQVLGAITGLDDGALDAALRDAVESALIELTPDGRVTFRHAAFRESLYESIAPGRRAGMHRQCADWFERQTARDVRARVATLAHHALRAAPFGDAERAVRYAREAATMAKAQYAYRDACAYYEAALEAGSWLEGFTPRDRAQLLLGWAEAKLWVGRRDQAWELLAEVRRIAVTLADPELGAHAVLGIGLVALVDEAGAPNLELRRWFEDALASPAIERSPELRVRLQARLAILLYWSSEPGPARRLAELALAGAEALGDPAVRGFAQLARVIANVDGAHGRDRLDALDALIAEARRQRLHAVEVPASVLRTYEILASGRADRLSEVLECDALMRQRGHPQGGQLLPCLLEQMQGSVEEAEAAARRFIARIESIVHTNGLSVTYAIRFFTERERGRLAELEPLAREARARHPRLFFWHVIPALAAFDAGDRERARALAQAAADHPELDARCDLTWLAGVFLLTDVLVATADVERARRFRAILEPSAERHVLLGTPVVYVGPVSHALGRLTASLGERARALAHFEHALQATRALGARRAYVEALIASAEVLVAGTKDERRHAAVRIDEALALADGLGFERLARLASEAQRQLASAARATKPAMITE